MDSPTSSHATKHTTKHLVLGGARSGKSSFAEGLVFADSDRQAVYVATATAGDDEMEARIQRHRLDRADQEWLVIEEPLELGDVLVEADADQHLLVDCLTLWVTNCLGDEDRWMQRRTAFLHALTACRAAVVLVSNEVGLGIVPLGAETRRFVDEVGRLHQDLASICHTVTFVAAGLPMTLKASATGSADA